MIPSCALYPVRKGTSAPVRFSFGDCVRKAPGPGGSNAGKNGRATVLCRSIDLPFAPTSLAPALTNNSLGVARKYPVIKEKFSELS